MTVEEQIFYDSAFWSPAKHGVHCFHKCPECFFVHNPGNTTKEFTETDVPGSRAGSAERPGREYAMAKLMTHVLPAAARRRFLVFGAGLSKDHEHIEGLRGVKSCALTDISNHQKSPKFVPIDAPGTYDVVIASEVIEHFESPREHLKNLMRLAGETGCVVAGTNLNSNSKLNTLKYPFAEGHVAYWSSRSIAHVCEEEGVLFDFRAFAVTGGPKKRLVFLTRSADTIRSVILLAGRAKHFLP